MYPLHRATRDEGNPDLFQPKERTVPTDEQIEQEIQNKGLTAPRVTPADIDAEIVSEFVFTAKTGAQYGGIYGDATQLRRLELLTFCVLVLRNGFTVTGESACASPENFDAEVGRKLARQHAVDKVWPLMGFRLRDQLHNIGTGEPPPERDA
jgi:hypothetical protein